MSVRSENFSKLIALIVVNDKSGVVGFLRSQGINASSSASDSSLIEAIFEGMQSESFRQGFSSWANSRYESQANFTYNRADGGFDPMSTQDGGSFDAMSSQEGTNLMEDNFANASGFDPMETQSGGFTPITTQGGSEANFSNVDGQDSWWKRTFGTRTEGTKSGVGNAIDELGGVGGILDKYLALRGDERASKDERAKANALVEAERLKLETALKMAEISKIEYDREMARLDKMQGGGGGNTVLYIVGGVVLLSAIGVAIYFATRKK